jgi:hypothetical protein
MPIRTLNQIVGEFQEIANQHRQINNFTVGTIEDFATSGTTNYPAWWVGYDSNAFASRTEDFTFTFWLVDRVKKDRSNLIEIHSDMKQVAMDVIAQLNDSGYGWKVSESVNLSAIYEPFHEDEIAGWSFDFTISQPFTKDVCQIPFISPIAIGRSQSGYNPNTPVNPITTYYGSFYDTTTQSVTAGGVKAMELNNTDLTCTNGFSIANNNLSRPTRITAQYSGVYDLQFSAQLNRETGGQPKQIDIWISVNGTPVPHSATGLNVQANAKKLVASWNWFVNLSAGQYVEIMWTQDDAIDILYLPASGSIPVDIPSLIVTINKIN